jgi:hypothetical protein
MQVLLGYAKDWQGQRPLGTHLQYRVPMAALPLRFSTPKPSSAPTMSVTTQRRSPADQKHTQQHVQSFDAKPEQCV